MIKCLDNPKTELYLNFKKHVLSHSFPWFYYSKSTPYDLDGSEYSNISLHSHTFLLRPEDTLDKIPKPNSNNLDIASKVFLEIFKYNNIPINYFLRINANYTQSYERVLNSVPHVDHPYEHKNALIYLTNSGGSTIVNQEMHDPSEDDVIIFGGETHYHQTAQKDRRVVLVATFN